MLAECFVRRWESAHVHWSHLFLLTHLTLRAPLIFKQIPAPGQDSTTAGERWNVFKISFWFLWLQHETRALLNFKWRIYSNLMAKSSAFGFHNCRPFPERISLRSPRDQQFRNCWDLLKGDNFCMQELDHDHLKQCGRWTALGGANCSIILKWWLPRGNFWTSPTYQFQHKRLQC